MQKQITKENSYNFEKSIIKNAIVQKLWMMEKFWLHIWIQREKLRYKHNKTFEGQNLVD
jgi:hypothetical protein